MVNSPIIKNATKALKMVNITASVAKALPIPSATTPKQDPIATFFLPILKQIHIYLENNRESKRIQYMSDMTPVTTVPNKIPSINTT